MKFKFIWNDKKNVEEVDIISNPANKARLLNMAVFSDDTLSIAVKETATNHSRKISLHTVETITAFGHLSKIKTIDGKEYYLQKRLKELICWEERGFYRINNSIILNLKTASGFATGKNAKLEVYTHSHRVYDVSRYYAKTIKERLLC